MLRVRVGTLLLVAIGGLCCTGEHRARGGGSGFSDRDAATGEEGDSTTADAGPERDTRPGSDQGEQGADAGPWANLPDPCIDPAADPMDPLYPVPFHLWRTLPGVWARTTGDLDQDGTPEVYVGYYDPGPDSDPFDPSWAVYEFDGEDLALRTTWKGFGPLSVGDLDQDGVPDMAATAENPVTSPGGQPDWETALVVRHSSAPGSFDLDVEAHNLVRNFTGGVYDAVFADTDQDGLMEVVTARPTWVIERREDGSMVDQYMDDPTALSYPDGTVQVGDFDQDGRIDISVPAFVPVRAVPGSYVRVVECRGEGEYVSVYRRPMPAWEARFGALGDPDGDGVPEFLRGGTAFMEQGGGGGVCWYFGIYKAFGDDMYGPVWERSFLYGGNNLTGSVAMGDTDGDGDDELAISMGDVVHVYEADAGWSLVRIAELPMCDLCWEAKVHFEDLDQDGRAELIVSRVAGIPYDELDPEGILIYKRGL